MRALASYTRERREERGGEGRRKEKGGVGGDEEEGGEELSGMREREKREGRQWKDCCLAMSFIIHTRPVRAHM